MQDKQRQRTLSDQQKLLLFHLFGDAKGDWRSAMNLAGYSEKTSISEVLTPLREEIISQCNSALASLAPKAISKMNDILNNGNTPGTSNQIKIIQSILDRVGLSSKSEDVSLKVPSGGLFILPAKEVPNYSVLEDEDEDNDDEEL